MVELMNERARTSISTIPSLTRMQVLVADVYREHYLTARRGLFDFPEEDEWIKKQTDRHFQNNPELYGTDTEQAQSPRH